MREESNIHMGIQEKKVLQHPLFRVGVMGASGSTGTELVRLLQHHPSARLSFATSRSYAGQSLRVVDPAAPDITLRAPDQVNTKQVDIVFVCLPHGTTSEVTERCLNDGARVIDLSGDLRLRSQKLHQSVYGTPRSQDLVREAVYGLTEFHRESLQGARLVSNPGCYPTCTMLALAPLVKQGLLQGTVVINATSGISGAGRQATPKTHYCMVAEDIRPYGLGRSHRHVPEIEQTIHHLSEEARPAPQVIFNPHTVPMERGMLATITVENRALTYNEVRELYQATYGTEPFVEVLPEGEVARIRSVSRTNQTVIGLHDVENSPHLVITCAIDNLQKGAAGQAIQNMNVMQGLPETSGLTPSFPFFNLENGELCS